MILIGTKYGYKVKSTLYGNFNRDRVEAEKIEVQRRAEQLMPFNLVKRNSDYDYEE